MARITFQPSGVRIEVPEETSLLEAAVQAGVSEVRCCGITPACGKCRAFVLDGEANLTPPDALERQGRRRLALLPGERFGCMARVIGDLGTNIEVEMAA